MDRDRSGGEGLSMKRDWRDRSGGAGLRITVRVPLTIALTIAVTIAVPISLQPVTCANKASHDVSVCEREDERSPARGPSIYYVSLSLSLSLSLSHTVYHTHTGAAGQADTRKGTRDKGTWSGESPSVHRRGTIHTLKKTLTIHTHTHTCSLSLSLSLSQTHTITGTWSGGSLSPRKCDLLGSDSPRCMSESCSC
jgi:hypothetical protein